MADDAGALLVRSGLVDASSLDEARAKVQTLGGTLGEQLVVNGVLGDDALTDFYKSRLLVPQVNPNTLARLPEKVIAAIPSDMAIELRAIPVSIDKDNNLTVAMSDPSDRHAVDEIQFFTGAYVVRAVATQMQIAWCLAHYYGHVTALGQRLLQGHAAQPSSERTVKAAVKPAARPKGDTDQVDAMRHKGIVPDAADGPLLARTSTDKRIVTVPPDPAPAASKPVPDPAAPQRLESDPAISDGVPQPEARSASGEIRVPGRRLASIKPPVPDAFGEEEDTEDAVIVDQPPELSGPVISIEAEEPENEDPTGPSKPVPKRTRKAKTDPPELAARAGEVNLKTAPIKKVDFDEQRIVISDELLEPPPAVSRTKTGEEQPDVSGEIRMKTQPDQPAATGSGITIEVSDESSAAVIVSEHQGDESAPVMLERRREASDAPTTVSPPILPDDDDVIVLDAKKPKAQRPERRTQVGVGAVTAATRAKDNAIPDELEDQPTGSRAAPVDNDPTTVDMTAAPLPEDYTPSDDAPVAPPAPDDDDDEDDVAPPPKPSPPKPSGQVKLDSVVARAPSDDDDDDDDEDEDDQPVRARGPATREMSAVELDEVIPGRKPEVVPAHIERRIDYDPVDDGWGPPGTTIPPPLLGAIPGSIDSRASGQIPIPNLDDTALIMAPPAPPETTHSQPTIAVPAPRALEDAIARTLDLIRKLDHAGERDEVVALMIGHLVETHKRAGFLAARGGELSLFAMNPRPAVTPFATLRLNTPSTLQDVIGTRLPYRGPIVDDISRTFLSAILGGNPAEVLLVPVAVRERVVGVLFGEQRHKHTFDDQLALAARAAGGALERILKAKK